MTDEKPEIDLGRFQKHKRKIPWGLIRKIIIGVATLLLIYYFMNQMEKAKQENHSEEGIEVEISD